ncbi:MAG TPA: TlpA disulfide reductase family protein [Niabella sp.]|jgi:peroxiredoxin|nr:TlpA disulfide reductase family protein [Niabella sp.]HUN02795.1 TlpA disulfide reductase family protein [Niabella sp.]
MALRLKIFVLLIAFSLPITGFTQMLEKPLPVPVFSLKNNEGKMVSIDDFKGKTILLDFWASWCFPCRIANKSLVKLYSKYQNKNFEIVSVSVDEDEKKWHKAIKKDKLTWPQLIDFSTAEESVAYRWQIKAIPINYLINAKGEIIAVNVDSDFIAKYLNQ